MLVTKNSTPEMGAMPEPADVVVVVAALDTLAGVRRSLGRDWTVRVAREALDT